jgi:hypothetical protein
VASPALLTSLGPDFESEYPALKVLGVAGDYSRVISKARWARHQLALVNLATTDYVDLDPYVAVIEDDPEAQGYRVFAELRHAPPVSLAHQIGDFFSSLHGVLEYLAHELVIREGERPDAQTCFPIIWTSADKDSGPTQVNIFRGRGKRRKALIKDELVLWMLNDIQPYHHGASAVRHPLQVLRVFNGICKHRHPVVLTSTSETAHITPRENSVARFLMNVYGFEDKDHLALVPYTDAPNGVKPSEVSFSPGVTVEGIPVELVDVEPAEGQLAQLLNFVNGRVAAPFEIFF